MSTTFVARAIASLLAEEQGTPSTGFVTVKSTGATGRVGAHDHAIPIIDGSLDDSMLVRVDWNDAEEDGGWDVTSAGTAVPVTSVLAGTGVNLDPNTEVRWDPELSGIEEVSVVDPSGLSGGTQSDVFGALRQIRHYRIVGGPLDVQSLFRGDVANYPAAVLSWTRSYPWDGSSTASGGSDSTRIGEGLRLFRHEWALYLVTSRLEQDIRRRRESDTLRDNVLRRLTDQVAHRGIALSAPDGLTVLEAGVHALTAATFIDLIRFTSTDVLEALNDDEIFNPWNQTRLRVQTEKQGVPPTEAPEIDIPDVTDPTLPDP